ncbi:MAG TPA: ATP-binding protein [Planctomycetota bacterium]|nr:ATP-binding protein [Planctomycetota bacterium]
MQDLKPDTHKQPPLILGRRLTYVVATIAILLAAVYLGVGIWLAREQFVDEFGQIADLTVDASRLSIAETNGATDLKHRLDATLQQARKLNATTEYIFVTDADGRILAATFADPPSADQLELARGHALSGGFRRAWDFPLNGHEVHHLAVALPHGEAGFLHFGFDESSVAVKVKGMALRLFASMLIGLLASAFLGWWIYRWMARPIRDLTQAVAAFGLGDFKQRVPSTTANGNDEVSLLAASFNHMADQLEQKILEQDRAQASLAQEKRRVQLILDGLIHGVAFYEADGTVAYWNQASQKHWRRPAAAAKPASYADLHANDPEILAAIDSLRAGTAFCRHVTLERAGAHFDVFLSLLPENEWDRGGGIVEISVDITHQIHTWRYLAHAEKLNVVGQLAAGLAHEINSPLDGALEVARMLEKSRLEPDLLRYVQAQRTALERIAVIIRRLLTFSRRNADPMTPVEIGEPLNEAVELVRYRLAKRGLELELPARESLRFLVQGEMLGLSQVFVNLLTNAIDATPDRSKVRIAIAQINAPAPAGNSVAISITDQGPGIAAAHQARIFTPFFTTKDVGQGTGLGLAITKNIVLEHGGRIEFHNEPPPWGACFTVHLPCLTVGGAEYLANTTATWRDDPSTAAPSQLQPDTAVTR